MPESDPIVSTEWLASHLDDPRLVILEVSSSRRDDAAYFDSHVPGARYVYWKDFCWHETSRDFPGSAEMARRLAQLGAGDESIVVLVGDPIQFATYPYWILTMAGQSAGVRVLDGGRATWESEGRPMTPVIPADPIPQNRSVGVDDSSSRVGRDDVLTHLESPQRVLVDMRSDEEYSGARVSPAWAEIDHGAERAGRIPGAVHLYFERLLNEDGTFKSADAVAEEFAAAGVGPGDAVVTYCRLSHRASLGWLLLTRRASRDGVRVYDGSWTEWGSMVGMPVERPPG